MCYQKRRLDQVLHYLFIPPRWEACPPPPCSRLQVLHRWSYDDDDAFQSCSCLGL